jgi:acyl-coenzyme A thioesterase PaaI-like protein
VADRQFEANGASLDELNDILASAEFLRPYGFTVTESAPGECTLRVAVVSTMERPGGVVSGMTLMGAADVAMWLAVMTLRGTSEYWVTSDMKTAFLRKARSEHLECVARILKPGKRIMYGSVECHGSDTGLVAHHVITYARSDA